ncbi:MAG: hypothetical protein EP347_00965 [Alphaproteobacteria bacterium]|nr:MAG: hypothetical protein EP347_00965 [Alphaproteobacteria bacterium]
MTSPAEHIRDLNLANNAFITAVATCLVENGIIRKDVLAGTVENFKREESVTPGAKAIIDVMLHSVLVGDAKPSDFN